MGSMIVPVPVALSPQLQEQEDGAGGEQEGDDRDDGHAERVRQVEIRREALLDPAIVVPALALVDRAERDEN